MEGDNPFLVTPDNQHDALAALERLVAIVVESENNGSQTENMSSNGRFDVNSSNVGNTNWPSCQTNNGSTIDIPLRSWCRDIASFRSVLVVVSIPDRNWKLGKGGISDWFDWKYKTIQKEKKNYDD